MEDATPSTLPFALVKINFQNVSHIHVINEHKRRKIFKTLTKGQPPCETNCNRKVSLTCLKCVAVWELYIPDQSDTRYPSFQIYLSYTHFKTYMAL